ncbi:MAG: sulfatase-like hydrolase/transferase [Phycisphaerae bacterium]|jgi:arylsulfatase A
MSPLRSWLKPLIGAVLGVTWVHANLARSEPPAAGRPNVVLIMADDLGYECIGANGGTSYRTPVLDRLAAGGMRFEHCYVQPLCTPTRVQLMTGVYNVRNYVNFGNIDPSVTTFAHLLKRAGYATCVAGKWQLGQDVELPRRLGFDAYYLWQHTRRPPRYANPGLEINGVEKDYTRGEYGPDLINAHARDFIVRHRDRPFFLYYPMILTHAPYQPTPDSEDWDPQARGETVNRKPEHFADMVAYMDKLIGRLLATLDEQGLRERTLVLFLGDNGTGRGTRSAMGARTVIGGKGTTTIAGMHVPLIVRWPGTVPAGRVCTDLVDSTDFLPTLCEAAGAEVPATLNIDGRSFLPQLRGQAGRPREWVYSWYSRDGTSRAARECVFDRRYKLYRTGEFYDLVEDPEEKRPLPPDTWKPEMAAAAKTFRAVLDQYKDARPRRLLRPG